MSESIKVYFVGTAGSGKSKLTHAYQLWSQQQGADVITVNLDPGVETLFYEPDIDIREWISLPEIMKLYNLGPNGAQIVAADLLSIKINEVVALLEKYGGDYVLIDTPGQIELFAFRESSKIITDMLDPLHSLMVFLYDPMVARTPHGLVSLMMLCATVQFRFQIPLVNVLSKTDILSEEEVEKIIQWSEEPYRLYSALIEEVQSMDTALSTEIFRALETIGSYKKIIPVSSEEETGLEDIYNAIQQVYFGGEDFVR